MVNLLDLRKLHGDVVETATLARLFLDPIESKLSGDPTKIHRRCVIGQYLEFFSHPDGLRDDLAPFGAIEAVSVCDLMHVAVVVFWDEASVAVALQRQAETPSPGWFATVPPKDAALPVPRMAHELIKAELYPPIVPATGTMAPPLFRLRNSPHEPAVMAPLRRDPGTTWFTLSRRSRVHGPVDGADGHLWMEGLNVFFHEDGTAGSRIDPAWIRVAALDPPDDDGDPPTYVPLFVTAANPTCVPLNSGSRALAPAGTAMLNLLNLRELHGDVVETATIARDLLVPLMTRLSGDPSSLHRRCVLARILDFFSNPDGVRDDLAPFGAIEAVAVHERVHKAVVVFWDEASVAVTLGHQGEASYGWFTAVPPLDAALPLCFFVPSVIEVALYSQAPAMARLAPRRRRLRPMFRSQNSPHERPLIQRGRDSGSTGFMPSSGRDAGTTSFMPSRDSLVYGPVLGPDDHLWIDGHNLVCHDHEQSVRSDPSWIRVTLLNSPGIYCGEPPIFVPLFSV